MQQAIDGIVALLRGEPRDLTGIVIDDSDTPAFNAQVYAIARKIPPGQTMTYGEIAERLGDKTAGARCRARRSGKIRLSDHHAVPSRAGGRRQDRRLLRQRRRGHEAAAADDRRGAQPGGPTLFDRLPLGCAAG